MDYTLFLHYIFAAFGGIALTFIELLEAFDNHLLKVLKARAILLLFILNGVTGMITYGLMRDI